jgi:UDP-glucose 4-epimerase
MRVLITGAAGFIGSRLAEALLTHGHEVMGIDDLSTGRIGNFPSKDQGEPLNGAWRSGVLIVGNILTDLPDVRPDVIYHCAASYKDRDMWERDSRTNVLGTINVVRLAQRAKARLIYFQTSLCYGLNPASPVKIEAPLDPHGSYAISKTAGEAYIRDSGVDYVSLRLANIYGPRNLSGPIPTFYQRLTEGKPVTVVDSRRDFVFVDDLIWVAVKAVTLGQGVYHVSSGSDYSIAELFDAVRSAMGAEVPDPEVTPRGPDDVATLLLDPSETQREFGWTARTSLADGVARAVAWYQEHGVTETYTHLAKS